MILRSLNEKRIKLSIDKKKYKCLQNDLFTLSAGSMSHLIECIVVAYCKDSKRLLEIEESFKNSNNKTIDYLLSDESIIFKKSLLKLTVGDFTKHRQVFSEKPMVYNWTITKAAYENLEHDKRSDCAPFAFVNDLLEEYIGFTIAQKERVVMAQAYLEIQETIEKNQEPFEYVSKEGSQYIMHPYRIVVDPDLQYTYVIGNSEAKANYDPTKFEPTIDNIRNIRFINLRYNKKRHCWIIPRVGEKIKINSEAIEKRLSEVSPAFIGEKVYDVKVLLNEWGERTYKSIIQNRPRFISRSNKYVDGYKEYTFRCTIFQAVIYFMNFEDSAKIISPPEAVERIKERLKITIKMYM